MERFTRPDGLPPVNGYSHAVRFSGELVAVSGQVPMDGEGQVVGADDPEAQVRQVFTNLATALAAAGSGLDRVVKLTVYLTDLADLPTFRTVRDQFIDPAAPPASSLVQVSALVHPAFRVEIDALAIVRQQFTPDPSEAAGLREELRVPGEVRDEVLTRLETEGLLPQSWQPRR